jgi:hypothetical protein
MMKKQTITGYKKTARGNWYFTDAKGYGLGLRRDYSQFTLDMLSLTFIMIAFITNG